jgi:predicted acyltransferase
LYESLSNFRPAGITGDLVQQFFHHPWHGLHFWDLVQPGFMTMAGAALYISYYKRTEKGINWQNNFRHIATRCLKLFLLVTGLHCIYAGKLVWELWNILTQLSFTTIIAYVVIRWSFAYQLVVSILLLLLTELLYRTVLMPGFDQPFTEHRNFGAWMDTVLMGKINTDGWVAINIIPTAAHTIWGVLAGKLLINKSNSLQKASRLIIAGTIGLAAGYMLDIMSVTPIIKRIATSSFVLVSGGWILLIMAFLYWLTDIKKQNRYAWIFVVVGMNSIFIYMLFETLGHQWLNQATSIFVKGFAGMAGVSLLWQAVVSALATLFIEWYACYWLYRKKIFFKL